MNFILNAYILICIMLFLFDIAFIVLKNINTEKITSTSSDIEKNLQEILKNHKNYNYLRRDISKKIEKTNNLVELIDIVENKKLDIPYEILLEIRDLVLEKRDIYIKKKEVEKAYYPYALSIFDYKNKELTYYEKIEIIDFLECNSIYTFVNTMNLIYKISDLELLEMALEKINDTDIFYHKKLLVDGLLEYSGDAENLKESIEKNFYKYNDAIKESIVDFCRMKKININKLCMDILNKDKKIYLEVRYAAMRYFISNECKEAKEYFLNILSKQDSDWIEKMLAIQGLNIYKSDDIYKVVKEYVTDKNWYVRNAAIKYVHNKDISKNEILSIIRKYDKHTNEELLYEYRNEEDISEYIKEIIMKQKDDEIESKEE